MTPSYSAAALGLALAFVPAGGVQAEIVIGMAGPLSGPLESLGRQMLLGAQTAVLDINAAGGVLGEPLVLEIGDDVCNQRKADALANQMAGRGIVFMAGHLCSLASIAASRVYDEQRIIQISPGTTLPKYTDERPGPGILRLAGRDDQQALVTGRFLASRYADRNIAILHDGSTRGKGLADGTQAAMNAAGKFETLSESYVEGERDFAKLVAILQRTGIGAVYFGGRDVDAALLASEMRSVGLTADLIGSDSLATNRFWSISDGAAEGAMMTYPPDPRLGKNAAELVARFRTAGIEPEGYVLPTYAAVQAWAQAVESAGSVDFEAVAEALNQGVFSTVLGDVNFDQKGDAEMTGYVVHRWTDGAFEAL